jgi:hypothetical protein
LASAPVIGEKLPPLEELVARVPANVLGILDDLFRVKFTGVRKFAAPGDIVPAGRAGGRTEQR